MLADLEGDLVSELDRLYAALGVPGASLAVRHGDDTVAVGAGVTSVDHPLAVDGDTLFQVASITKTFTATLAAMLAVEDRVDLDTPLVHWLPWWRPPAPIEPDAITLRVVLQHTGGWDGDHLFGFPLDPATPVDEVLGALVAARPHGNPPGAVFSYDNSGFSLAGRVVEIVEGEPFGVVLKRRILRPLGIRLAATTADEAITHRVAIPHLGGIGDGLPVVIRAGGWQKRWELAPWDVPAGGLVTSMAGLSTWAAANFGEHPDVISPEVLGLTHAAAVDAGSGTEIGLAWHIDAMVDGTQRLGHGGLTVGYCSYLAVVPEHRFAVAVSTNATTGGRLCAEAYQFALRRVLDLDDPRPDPLAEPASVDEFAGRYLGPWSTIELTPTGEPGRLSVIEHSHPSTGGRWVPPPPPPAIVAVCGVDELVQVEPETAAYRIAQIVRDASGRARWFRWGSRLHDRDAAPRFWP